LSMDDGGKASPWNNDGPHCQGPTVVVVDALGVKLHTGFQILIAICDSPWTDTGPIHQ
jgi:hypothetical protein